MEIDADLASVMTAAHTSSDPREQLRHIVDFNLRFFERGADVVDIVLGAGIAERELATLAREGDERRRQGQEGFIQQWSQRGVLRPGLTTGDAADILWAMTGPEFMRLFVNGSGWTFERFGEWSLAVLEAQLFGS
jgi:hypothetical protein